LSRKNKLARRSEELRARRRGAAAGRPPGRARPRVASRFKRVLNQMSLADFAHSIALESQMQTELMAK